MPMETKKAIIRASTETSTVDSHVKALRHKLGADMIRTVHGVGYAFEPPTE